MMEPSGIFTTAVVFGLSAGLSPGPLLTLVIAETLKRGIAAGIRIAIAPLITDLPIIAGCLMLLATFAHAAAFVGVVALLGGLFIAWMGYENIRFTGAGNSTGALQTSQLRTGVIANLLNPYPYLFWLTVGGPLILKTARNSLFSAALFLSLFYGCLVGSKIIVAGAVGRSRRFLGSRAYIWIIRFLGVLLVIFAWVFFREGLGQFGWI
jgi:threonine/homoserine/homoserine lactone efflux protein